MTSVRGWTAARRLTGRRLTARRLIVAAAVFELAAFFALTPETVLAGALAVCGLVLVRRFPVSGVLLTLPAMAIGYAWLTPMLALYDVTVAAASRRRVLLCAAAVFVSAMWPWPVGLMAEWTWEDHLLAVESSLMLSIGPTALGLLVRTREELTDRLADLVVSQAREHRLVAERAITRERERLARDMHDTISHHVGIVVVQAGALSVTTDDPEVRKDAEVIRGHGVSTLEELRGMVSVLRTSKGAADQAADQVKLADVTALVQESRLDISLDIAVPPERRWPPSVECAAFRTVQEALNNARKHAPGAPVSIVLSLSADQRALIVEVRNGATDLPGPPGGTPVGGHGLAGLRERAALVGGTLQARPTEGSGFLVRAVLPADGADAPV